MAEQVCAREGCTKPVPPAAVLHLDPFCSSTCFKAAQGAMTVEEAEGEQQRSDAAAASADRGGWRAAAAVSFEKAYGKGAKRK